MLGFGPLATIPLGGLPAVGSASYSATTTESVGASESCSAYIVFAGGIAESITATDSSGAAGQTAASITESATASDSSVAIFSISAQESEAVTATDSWAATIAIWTAVTESAAASDSSAASGIFPVSVSEPASAADSQSGALITSASASEAVGVADSFLAGLGSSASVSEAVAAGADQDADGTAYFVAEVHEPANAGEAWTAVYTASGFIEEAVSVSDSSGRFLATAALVGESIAALDASFAGVVIFASVIEAAPQYADCSAQFVATASSINAAFASDWSYGAVPVSASVIELISLGDQWGGAFFHPPPWQHDPDLITLEAKLRQDPARIAEGLERLKDENKNILAGLGKAGIFF